jgi:hypothetical protein
MWPSSEYEVDVTYFFLILCLSLYFSAVHFGCVTTLLAPHTFFPFSFTINFLFFLRVSQTVPNLISVEISGSYGGEYEDDFWNVALCCLVDVSEVLVASTIALVMETARTFGK